MTWTEAVVDYNIMRGKLDPPCLCIGRDDEEHRARRVESYFRSGVWDEYALGKAVIAGWIPLERAEALRAEKRASEELNHHA